MKKFFIKHKKRFFCGFLCVVFCSLFTFNCFASNYTYRSYSDLTATNSTYLALKEMANGLVANSNYKTLSFRTETETHFLVLDSDVLDYIDWYDTYFVIPAEAVISDYYYLNSVPVGYGNATRYFVKINSYDFFEGDTFKIYLNHTFVSNVDWGLSVPNTTDINVDMSNFIYMFLTIVILLVFIIIMRMR